MTNLTSLTSLNMENSNVSGEIPPSFFALQSLSEVKLSNNNINGTLDLSEATEQLLLVTMENNEIEILKNGTHDNLAHLWLKDNPVCRLNSSLSSETMCVESFSSNVPNVTYGINPNCINTNCLSQIIYSVSPECTCAIPFQGELIYRAPKFTSLSNASLIPMLVAALASSLSVDLTQMQVLSAYVNAQNQLLVFIAIFPSGSTTTWSPDDIMRMSSALGNVSPPPEIGYAHGQFRPSPYPGFNIVDSFKSGLSMGAKLGIAVGTALLVLVILVVGFLAYLQKQRADKAVELTTPFGTWGQSGSQDSGSPPKLKGTRAFSFAELKKATSNFSESNKVGSGGYGKIYSGIISSGERVAIKRAQANSMQGATEFKNEIELLSRVHHKNVVGLVGFCFEQGEQMLVYEYMAGGSLRDCLMGRGGVRLSWRRRTMIALGAARGITYLHELVNPPIIHRDIKSTNILLDEKKVAKVADFGLSKTGPEDFGKGKQHVSTQVKGTLGYLDPEYYTSQQLTEKSDVYSYGVVLLELLTARAPIEHGKYVVKEVKIAIDKGGLGALRSMLDPRIGDEELSELNTFVRIALSCVEEAASNRPSMGEVVRQLEELIGQDYPESGSSNIDLQKGHPIHIPYGSDSDYLHTYNSRDSSSPFPNSSSHVPPSFGSR